LRISSARWDLFFPEAGLQRKRKIIVGKKELLAAKMKGGWDPGNLSRPLFEKNGTITGHFP